MGELDSDLRPTIVECGGEFPQHGNEIIAINRHDIGRVVSPRRLDHAIFDKNQPNAAPRSFMVERDHLIRNEAVFCKVRRHRRHDEAVAQRHSTERDGL